MIESLLKREGFYLTMKILYDTNQMSYKEFLSELNQVSYYNAFYRIQEELEKLDIIKTYLSRAGKKMIKLTAKGGVIAALYHSLILKLTEMEAIK